jgi:hypothetical protein
MATEITSADIEGLAERLEGMELSDHDREVLTGVFTLAGVAAGAQLNDVEGFAIYMSPGQKQGVPVYMQPTPLTPGAKPGGGGLVNGFSWGLQGVGDPTGVPAVQ